MWLQLLDSMVTPCGYSLWAVWLHHVATACGQYGHTMWYSLWAVWSHHVVQPVGSMITPCGTACGQYDHTMWYSLWAVWSHREQVQSHNQGRQLVPPPPHPTPDWSAPTMGTPVHMASILEERAIHRNGSQGNEELALSISLVNATSRSQLRRASLT